MLPRRRVLPSGKSSPGHGQDYSDPSHNKQSKTQTSPPHMSRGISTKVRRYTKPRRSGVRAVDRSLVSRHEGYSFLGSRRSGGARRVLKEMRCGPTLSTKRIVQVPNAGNQLLAFPLCRSTVKPRTGTRPGHVQHRAARHSDEYARVDTPVMSNNDVSTPDTIPRPTLSDSVDWRSPGVRLVLLTLREAGACACGK